MFVVGAERRAFSKQHACTDLQQPGRRGRLNLAEVRAGDVTVHGVRPEELSVVEDVEAFYLQLQGRAFVKFVLFRHGEIVLSLPGP